jgi:hypothetical protein
MRHKLKLGVIACDLRWFGNPVGSKKHQEELLATLIGDALEGSAVLLNSPTVGREFQGKQWIGYHHKRKFEFLDEWAASIDPTVPH